MSPKKTPNKKPARRSIKATSSQASARRKASKAASASRKRSARKAAEKAVESVGRAAVKPAEMSGDVLEFVQAIDDYKRLKGRPFPNWSEVLEILKGLGYERTEQ